MTPPSRYTEIAIAFHWLLALMIVIAFCVGLYMHELPMSPTRLKLFNYHKWAGIVILSLSALRLLWRLTHRPPPDLPMPAWQTHIAHVTHIAFYFLFFAVPLAGWAYSSAAGIPIVVFGVLPLPDFVSPDKALASVLKGAHALLAFTLAGFVVLHVLGALKHVVVDRDTLLARMLPGRP